MIFNPIAFIKQKILGATVGSILFVGANKDLQQNNANLFWDDTNNRLGVGGPAANAKLTIGTDTTVATGGLYFGTDVSLFRSAANTLRTNADFKVTNLSNTAENNIYVSPIYFKAATSQSAAVFVIAANSGQTGDMMQLQDSSGSPVDLVTTDGRMALRYIGAQAAVLAIATSYSEYRGVVVKAHTTQNVNLYEAWDSGGSVIFSVTPSGGVVVNGTALFNNTVRLKGYTVATLPAGTQGDTAFITDGAGVPAKGIAPTGGGASVGVVFYDGVGWKGI